MRRRATWIVRCSALASLALVSASALAQDAPASAAEVTGAQASLVMVMLRNVVEMLLYSLVGLVILILGFKALDLCTPFSLNKEIAEDDNVAAGVVVAGLLVALGLIIAASIAPF